MTSPTNIDLKVYFLVERLNGFNLTDVTVSANDNN